MRVLHVGVAIATRNRPNMLAACLSSISALDMPQNVTLDVIIVENDDAKHSAPVVDAFRRTSGLTVHHVLETEPGIPQARNRALTEALDRGCDLLAMLDDDEVAATGWLAALVATFRKTGDTLIGGPVQVAPPDRSLGNWQRFVHRGLAQRKQFYERRNARRAKASRKPVVVTNNWLCNLNFIRENGLRFDEALRFSGGEDVAFYRAALAAGAPTGWAVGARVQETVPVERLSLAYVFRRARDQAMRRHFQRDARHGKLAMGVKRVKATGVIVLRWIGQIVVLPACPAYSVVGMAHEWGKLIGTFHGMAGRNSSHYQVVTGA